MTSVNCASSFQFLNRCSVITVWPENKIVLAEIPILDQIIEKKLNTYSRLTLINPFMHNIP